MNETLTPPNVAVDKKRPDPLDFLENGPIMSSRLEDDMYNFTMGQYIHQHHPNIDVEYAFKNRTKSVCLRDHIKGEDLEHELNLASCLIPSRDEISYLASARGASGRFLFSENYLRALPRYTIPRYAIGEKDGDFTIKFRGPWAHSIYGELPGLKVVNSLYTRAMLRRMSKEERQATYDLGNRKLDEKIERLKANPNIVWMDFGNRRAACSLWHKHVVETLKKNFPLKQFIGVSNVYLAMKTGLPPKGTKAHQLDMVLAGIAPQTTEGIKAAISASLNEWEKMYGPDLLLALPDTFGTDFYNSLLTTEQVVSWDGDRQDSGDIYKFGAKQITKYKNHGVDPRSKILAPSDGLELDVMEDVEQFFRGTLRTVFGWGTNLTNDWGIKPLSIVIKPMTANGHGLVKLSDNPAKAMGRPEDVERMMRLTNYGVHESTDCKY